jgi:superfamily II DNA or RNA helicase/translation initiation factor 2 alpha subunit (eIF-2alpha)
MENIMDFKEGLYEQLITKSLKEYIDNANKNIEIEEVEKEEANVILAKHLKGVLELALRQINEEKKEDKDSLDKQISLSNKIIKLICEERGEDFLEDLVSQEGKMLYAITPKENNITTVNKKVKAIRPKTPLTQSSLFTNATNEPNLANELSLEIRSSDSVDILVSFIKWSGIRILKEALEEFTKHNNLRVITTSYMGASDYRAIEFLSQLPNTEVKISYDTKRTKHHAKAYMFKRETGFSTAYIGSSNISKSAIDNGLEWNIKVTEKDSRDVLDKFEATFESYWNDEEFITFDISQKDILLKALKSEKYKGEEDAIYDFNIKPNYFQKEILEKLKVEREVYNKHKNLVVAATGTGKTVISAFDFKRFLKDHRGENIKLLFVAHKQEILKQSLGTFRTVLKDRNFGELFYNGKITNSLDQVFVTIQTFNSQRLYEKTTEDYYDFIIVDEFHHSAAESYQKLLSYYKPKILLGLTATPERMDGKNVLEYFEDRIAAELRLGEAIDNKLLSPFQYFCITDSIDYSKVKWVRGGYDKDQLDKLISSDTQRADLVIKSMYEYLTDMETTIGIGFCTSVDHAKFMKDYFNRRNIKAEVLYGGSSEAEREEAIHNLRSGKLKFIFTVDLFNEGVDIQEVNTLLFLRPTESLTVFIQQLGRGLRIAEGKECVTVLDYVGQANKQYNYYEKFAAISRKKGKELKESIEENNVLLPKGCYLYMEKVAKEYILQNIGEYINDKRGLVKKIKDIAYEKGNNISLKDFMTSYDVELLDIYKTKGSLRGKSINNSFYRLCVEAGIKDNFDCKDETILANSLGKVTFINSIKMLKLLIEVTENFDKYKDHSFNEAEEKLLLMFHYTLWGNSLNEFKMKTAFESIIRLSENKEIFQEVLEILKYNYNNLSVVSKKDRAMESSPLEAHCTYTTDQILVALGKHTADKKYNFQEGVLHVKEKNLDAFFITLNKVEKHYSPSTMYKDYAISSELFHWQTQSKISPETPTCERYINHKKNNHKILLFVRENKKDKGFTTAFTYLGTADYVRHYGRLPVNIIWKLHEPLPAGIEVKAEKAL